MTSINAKEYRNYKIDYAHHILYFDYTFERKAQIPNSKEYKLYHTLRHDFPNFGVEVKSHRKPSDNPRRRLTYKAMLAYMSSFNEADLLIEEFNAVKAKYDGKYSYVRKWFEDRFPNYGEVHALNYTVTDRFIGKGVYAIEFTPAPEAMPDSDIETVEVVFDENGEVIE